MCADSRRHGKRSRIGKGSTIYVNRRVPSGEYITVSTTTHEYDARVHAEEESARCHDVILLYRDASEAFARYTDGHEVVNEEGPPWPLKRST
jgi:hypothetical protein